MGQRKMIELYASDWNHLQTSKTNAPSQRSIARAYNIAESAIHKILQNEESIVQHAQFSSESLKQSTVCAAIFSCHTR